ncbi:hypothetical protein SDC9_70164 [bioreactor metagenome]|uniref:Type II secretion system protein n=1 Tax=bioreactor metagenome TaxID=1076179 RepID=A0A644Y5H4_9ZZZZ
MKNTVNRSSLFLTELIMDLFIFAVCAAVCAGLLIKAYGMSRQSTELTQEVYIAQSAAERFRQGEDIISQCRYHADGTPCGGETGCGDDDYVVEAEITRTDGLRTAKLLVRKSEPRKDSASYVLTVTVPEEVSAG